MPTLQEDLQQQLQTFVAWTQQHIRGDEKGQAQIFLDRLFQAFGHRGVQEAGGILEDRIKHKQGSRTTTSFADLVVPGRVLIEMKKRGEDLRNHYAQAFDYWVHLVPNRPKFVILCNFDEFWIYELDYQIDDPRDKVRLTDLPTRWGPLAFLSAVELSPVFATDLIAVTKEAAKDLSEVLKRLLARDIVLEDAQRFVLQCMLALFAEDIDLLEKYTFTNLVKECLQPGKSSYDILTPLFEAMNRSGGTPAGRFHDVDYFNGGIFSHIVPIALSGMELFYLDKATGYNWAVIRPAIFGTIFEDSMNRNERHQIGAHYTSEIDIQRIVQPVIVRPWRERIEAAASEDELRRLQTELSRYQVLDPACGSGNFLYIAYREMKRLEKLIIDKIHTLTGRAEMNLGLVGSHQFWGFDIKPFAVELAKVTLMIAKKLAVDELGLGEKPLPLDNLDSNIRAADALFETWPAFDACISNPPYMGAKVLKQEHDVDYVNRVRDAFPDVPGNADYCVYWFRKAHGVMQVGARAGMVGTNTIRQNYSREGGLDYIVGHDGHIFEAVSTMPWEGDAVVYVSIACWSKGLPPVKTARLWIENAKQFIEQPEINSALSANIDLKSAHVLSINTRVKLTYNGVVPGHEAFRLTPEQAQRFYQQDRANDEVILPFLSGQDLISKTSSVPSRFLIDLNHFDIIEAQQFRAVFEYIKTKVLPYREANAKREAEANDRARIANPRARLNHDHAGFLQNWWKNSRGRPELIAWISQFSRYIVCSEVTKRPIFEFISSTIIPDHGLQVFTFEDDYSYGILQSDIHWKWFVEKCSTLKGDYRYTPHSVFDTFPWPQQPSTAQVKAVAEAARKLHEYRRAAMKRDTKLTLRKMYASLELPGANPLRDLHTTLDKAVMQAYGFDPKDDLLKQVLYLNETVYARIQAGEPTTPPGLPADITDRQALISGGCVQPRELL